ncbi:MAG TPA: DUF6152 family protein [Terriglobia bacterium]|nr:DUF6152 family protein [Terriglobia bacterium]
MRSRIACIISLALSIGFLNVAAASAHHSFAPHFDATKKVNISGTVKAYEARNPHSYLHVDAVDENGRTREYVCESHGTTQLSRIGLTPQIFKAGTKIRVVGSLSRHSPYMCFFETVELADGRTLNVNGPGGSSPTPQSTAVAQRKDIFGTWLLAPIPNRSTSGPQPMMQFLTPAGEKAVAAYDPFKDDPVFRCDPVAIRRVWGAPSTPLEIIRDGADVVLRHEWMDVKRVIHMREKAVPKGTRRTSLGYSIGRWEGDTLVIETSNFSAGVLNQYVEQQGQPTKGLLHSDALTTVERLHLDVARQRLVVEIDMTDPEFFKQAFPRATYEYSASNLKIEPFKCSPEGLTGPITNK